MAKKSGMFSADLRPACRAYAQEFIHRLEQLRVWPRPAGIPWPLLGEDYTWPDVDNLPAMAAACDALYEHEWLRPMYASERLKYDADAFRWVIQPLAERVAAHISAGQTFNRAFDRWYRTFLAELRRPDVTIVRVHCLPFMTSDLRRIPLDSTSSLERVGGSSTLRFLMPDCQPPVEAWSISQARGWALVSRYRVKKEDSVTSWDTPGFDDGNRSRAAQTALRLLRSGDYSYGLDVEAHLGTLPFRSPITYSDQPILPIPNKTKVRAQDAPAVRRLFKHLLSQAASSPAEESLLPLRLSNALYRFNRSCEDLGWMNEALQLVVVMEGLLGVQEEAKFRLATRMALFLGTDDDDLKTVYRLVRALYDARSIPAHAKEIKPDDWKKFYKAMMGTSVPQIKLGYITEELRVIDDAVEAGRDVARRLVLACLHLKDVADSEFRWPFGKDFDQLLLTRDRGTLQRLAKVRRGITF